MERVIAAIVATMLFASCGLAASAAETEAAADPYIDESRNIGAIDTVDVYGEPFTRAGLIDSKLVMFNIWTTWCPPCLEEMPALADIARERADTGFRLVGVMADAISELGIYDAKTVEVGKDIISKLGVEYTVIIPDEALLTGVISAIYAVPTTVFTDGHGNIISGVVGSRTKEEWNALIDELTAKVVQDEQPEETTVP